MTKPVRTFNQTVGTASDPAPLITDIDAINKMFDPLQSGGGIATENIQDSAVSTDKIADGAVTAVKVAADVATQAELDTHTTDTDNPHSVTATQVGALVSIEGVSNPGGNIDIVPGTGIQITPNQLTNSITITATGEAIPGAHADTHASAGSDPITPSSIGASADNHAHDDAVSGGASGFMAGTDKAVVNGLNTAQKVLDQVKTVDGTGSGLDADLLDGNEATSFIPKSLLMAQGDVIYASAIATPSRLAKGSAGQALIMNAGATAPEWGFPGRFKVGVLTRDSSLATGTQAVTGVGFKPKALILLAVGANAGEMSIAFYDGTTNAGIYDNYNATANTYGFYGGLRFMQSATIYYLGVVNSFDSDGFTMGWTRQLEKTGTLSIRYIAIR